MPIYDIYSKRQKRLRGEIPDVYQYDEIPVKLRAQIRNLVKRTLGCYHMSDDYFNSYSVNNKDYFVAHQILADEWGENYQDPNNDIDDYIFKRLSLENDTEICMDIIEVFFKIINYGDKYISHKDKIIEELNTRFKENGVGYQFENGQIMRIDSTFTHEEIIKPALHLLSADPDYQETLNEFLNAHEHY